MQHGSGMVWHQHKHLISYLWLVIFFKFNQNHSLLIKKSQLVLFASFLDEYMGLAKFLGPPRHYPPFFG